MLAWLSFGLGFGVAKLACPEATLGLVVLHCIADQSKSFCSITDGLQLAAFLVSVASSMVPSGTMLLR